MTLLFAGVFFPLLCVLVLAVCILVMQRPGVCSMCLYPLMLHFELIKSILYRKKDEDRTLDSKVHIA